MTGECAITDVQQYFRRGDLTTVALVEVILDQIERHDTAGLTLCAVISVAPREKLLNRARELDDERQKGHARSTLHGIPFLLKAFNALPVTLPRASNWF